MIFKENGFGSIVKMIEIYLDIEELKYSGLSDEEIQGYLEFFVDSWFANITIENENKDNNK